MASETNFKIVAALFHTLPGKPESPPALPVGNVQVSGGYVYPEYVGNIELQAEERSTCSFWERLFSNPPSRPTEDEEEKKQYQELYGG